MPFFQGAASRLPFMYFVPELYRFEVSALNVGIFIGSYQFCRSLTCMLSVPFPKASQFFGTVVALIGYIISIFFDGKDLTFFVVGTIIIGFCETMPNFQVLLKELYICDQETLGNKIKLQYVSIIMGVLLAFLGGGIIYENHGILGTSIMGTILMTCELWACIHTFYIQYTNKQVIDLLPKEGVEEHKEEGGDGHAHGGDKPTTALQRKLTTITLANIPESEHEKHGQQFVKEFIHFSEQKVPPNWVSYLITLTLGLEAITIGYALSIGPLYIITQFGKSSSFVGALFAISQAVSAGYVLVVGNLSKSWQKKFNKYTYAAPWNFIFFYFGIGVSALGISLTGFKGCVFFFFTLVTFNDLASLRLNMFNGQISSIHGYKQVCPMAQICRRTLNTVTALTGPLLFENLISFHKCLSLCRPLCPLSGLGF